MKHKRGISVVMAAALLCSSVSLNISSAETSDVKSWGDNASYIIDYDTATVVITGKGELENTDTLKLSSPFKDDTFIEKVVIEEGITSICKNAFSGCTNLKEVDLPDSMESIGSNAFSGTEIYGSQIVDGENTFITVDNWIIDYSKKGEDITELVIPDGIVGIGSEAFKRTSKKGSYVYRVGNVEKIYFPDSLKHINYGAFIDEEMKLRELELPEKNDLYIDSYAFNNAFCDPTEEFITTDNEDGMLEITIPGNVKSIGSGAFKDDKRIGSITFEYGIQKIGDNSFNGCTISDKVTVPDSLERLGKGAFANTPFEKAFDESSDKVLYLGNWLYKVNKNNASFVDIHEGTIGIADSPGIAKTTDYKLPSSLKYIGAYAFYETNKTEIILPECLEKIYTSAFEGSSLKQVEFNDKLTYIGEYAFRKCNGLTDVVIPESVSYIGNGAFYISFGIYDDTKVTVLNPDCQIEQVRTVSGYGIEYTLNFKNIIGYSGSTAEEYSSTFANISDLLPVYNARVFTAIDTETKPDDQTTSDDQTSSDENEKLMLGDVNGDGEINVTDIAMIAAHIKGIKALDENGIKAADANGDGDVNVTDIAMIAAHIKGIKAIG